MECFLWSSDAVLKPRSPQRGRGPSPETRSQPLASAHPWLPASRDMAKEACSQTSVEPHSWRAGIRYAVSHLGKPRGGRGLSPCPQRGSLMPAIYADIIALWDLQLGTSVCIYPNLVPKTWVQVLETYSKMIPGNTWRRMRD